MTLNWYLDSDGESHRLHSTMGWTSDVFRDVELPADDLITLGTIDAAALNLAVEEIIRALQALPDVGEAGVELLHLASGDRDGTEYLTVCGKTAHAAASRALPWTPRRERPQFHGAATPESLEALHGAAGSTKLLLGADEDWTATLVLAGAADTHRAQLARDHLGDPPLRLIEGDSLISCTLERDPFTHLVTRIAADQNLTLALVPGRVIIRSADGPVGTLEAETTGAPQQATVPAGRLAAGLHALPVGVHQLYLSLFDDQENPTVRLDDPRIEARFSVLSSGWRYR